MERYAPTSALVANPRALVAPPWDSGVEYSGPASLASSIAVAMSIPDDLPPPTDRYYIALSVFDGAESYDQVGFANENGSWQAYYSTASVCGTRPATHWDALGLDRAKTYDFEMSIVGGGDVLFEAFSGTGAAVWQETVHTGATYFQVQSTQTCGAAVLPGLTETEVVYAAALGNPPYNFVLTNASEDGRSESQWVDLPGSNNTTTVAHNGSDLTIFNEPFTIGFASSPDRVTVEAAGSSQELQTKVSVVMESTGANVGLSVFTSAASWGFSATPASGNASFVSVVNVNIPPTVTPGKYLVEILASNAGGLSNRIGLLITALAGLSLSVRTDPTSGEMDANETATIQPNATGGRPAYTYSWPSLPTGCAATASDTATCRFALPGTYSQLVSVSDTLNYAFYRDVTVSVVRDPVLSFTSGTTRVGLGGELSLIVNLTGGLPPFAIVWQGLPLGCGTVNATTLTCHPTATGEYAVTMISTDHTGFRSSVTVSLRVVNPTSPYSADLGTVGLILVAAGLLALIAACVVVLVRRHRRR